MIRILISAIALLFLFSSISFSKLASSFSEIQPLRLLLVFLLLVPGLLVRSYRWLLLFKNEAFSITFSDSTKLLMTGMCLNLVLPASLGDVAKSYFGYRWYGIKERMLSISMVDKVVALGSVGLLGFPFAVYQQNYIIGILSLLIILASVFFLSLPFLARRGHVFQRFISFSTRFLRNKVDVSQIITHTQTTGRKLICAIILSVMGWLITYFQLYLIFRGMGVQLSVFYVFAVAPFLTLVRLFPFAMQGLGTDELAICFVFRQAGITYEEAMATALLYRLFLLILPGLAGMFFMLRQKPSDVNDITSVTDNPQ